MKKIQLDIKLLHSTKSIKFISLPKVDRLMTSISKDGLKKAPLVYQHNDTWYIIDGHHRVLCNLRLGLKVITCYQIDQSDRLGYNLSIVDDLDDNIVKNWFILVDRLYK